MTLNLPAVIEIAREKCLPGRESAVLNEAMWAARKLTDPVERRPAAFLTRRRDRRRPRRR